MSPSGMSDSFNLTSSEFYRNPKISPTDSVPTLLCVIVYILKSFTLRSAYSSCSLVFMSCWTLDHFGTLIYFNICEIFIIFINYKRVKAEFELNKLFLESNPNGNIWYLSRKKIFVISSFCCLYVS